MSRHWIRLSGVWCTLGTQNPIHALRGLDVSIAEGEFVATIGPSGSGKSTFLYLVSGLRQPTQGARTVLGVENPSPREMASMRRSRIGFVFQSFHLIPHLTAVENVAMAGRYSRTSERRCLRRAEVLMGQLGLADRLRHRPGALSGGEQQRVAIGRALFNEPDLLLADEPTGNLDSDTSLEILTILSEIHRLGTTVVLVTHSTEAAAFASRVVEMTDGRIDHRGSTSVPTC
ncbi:MAG: ABC transporter ATP-binding protein [Acidimicrobiia bacterium]|nr:ABC transporter ATP-binding protein [Acidimicrobiia bacterium]